MLPQSGPSSQVCRRLFCSPGAATRCTSSSSSANTKSICCCCAARTTTARASCERYHTPTLQSPICSTVSLWLPLRTLRFRFTPPLAYRIPEARACLPAAVAHISRPPAGQEASQGVYPAALLPEPAPVKFKGLKERRHLFTRACGRNWRALARRASSIARFTHGPRLELTHTRCRGTSPPAN